VIRGDILKNKLFRFLNTDLLFQIAVFAAICVVCYVFNGFGTQFIVVLSIALFGLLVQILRKWVVSRNVVSKLKSLARALETAESGSDSMFPMPIVIVGKTGNVAWYNDLFFNNVLGGADAIDMPFSNITGSLDYRSLGIDTGAGECSFEGRYYMVYAAGNNSRSEKMRAYYFSDITELKETAIEYELSRPAVAHISFDSYNELMKSVKDSEKTILAGRMELIVHEGLEKFGGAMLKTAPDHYVLVFEQRHIPEMKEAKFDLLDKTRELSGGENSLSTISIGIGYGGEGFSACDEMAVEALDMALGRGGDQAALRNADGFEFYGGKSRGVEKLTKVKTRLIATEIQSVIAGADNCLIMGHKLSDYDAIGSAIGMYRACINTGRQAHIVVDRSSTLAGDMIDVYDEMSEYRHIFVSPDKAMDMMTHNTLLIVVDVHLIEQLESKRIYEECEKVVVIDHHRKGVDYIDRAAVFCHEPFASSASEIVTELTQYMNSVQLTKTDAEALLTGIMLDTKKFSVRTGVRTFDAAAYLKKCGADSSEAQKYFAKDMREYRFMYEVISNAKDYKGCAIAVCKGKRNSDNKIMAIQAIDELLNFNEFRASFLVYEESYGVSVSARSMGAINVQVIMEKLGGGGHHTMAGAQFENATVEEICDRLYHAIDEYMKENK
ncbi:MAG: DHH family phosphoesterase, partial [Clostridia bacterium]|nr:DHH family phosphoesterase [Clostridia bacterium]